MEPKEFLAFLARLEKLKCNTRHSWTSSGRHESVAEHSWRLAMLALLLRDALEDNEVTAFRQLAALWEGADPADREVAAALIRVVLERNKR